MEYNNKFNIGDTVFLIEDRVVDATKVIGIMINKNDNTFTYHYNLSNGSYVKEEHLFKSREELIESL